VPRTPKIRSKQPLVLSATTGMTTISLRRRCRRSPRIACPAQRRGKVGPCSSPPFTHRTPNGERGQKTTWDMAEPATERRQRLGGDVTAIAQNSGRSLRLTDLRPSLRVRRLRIAGTAMHSERRLRRSLRVFAFGGDRASRRAHPRIGYGSAESVLAPGAVCARLAGIIRLSTVIAWAADWASFKLAS
jgi:hypothetical protein